MTRQPVRLDPLPVPRGVGLILQAAMLILVGLCLAAVVWAIDHGKTTAVVFGCVGLWLSVLLWLASFLLTRRPPR